MQYFYLVCIGYDEETWPQKIFLQEEQAVKWGRKNATKDKVERRYVFEYKLYRQPITTNGTLEYVKTLEPYGSDWDIDK
jgi:hypothetical protein